MGEPNFKIRGNSRYRCHWSSEVYSMKLLNSRLVRDTLTITGPCVKEEEEKTEQQNPQDVFSITNA